MYTFRVARSEDCRSIASIHKSQFGDHVSGILSIHLLEIFYRMHISAGAFLYVAESEGVVRGFVLGGEAAMLATVKRSFVKKNLAKVSLDFIVSPRSWLRILPSALSFLRSRKKPAQMLPLLNPVVWLLSIAVSEDAKAKSVASRLVGHFGSWVHGTFGEIDYRLGVRKENARAIRFYEKMGFAKERETDSTIIFIKNANEDMQKMA
jgi:ribosomal protein S18 acetylase RimI-like enzyme